MYASKIVLWSGLSKLWFVYFVPFKCVNWWEINQLNVFPTSWCWFMCRAAEMREAPATSWYFLRCPTTETGKTCVPHLSYSQSLHMGDISFWEYSVNPSVCWKDYWGEEKIWDVSFHWELCYVPFSWRLLLAWTYLPNVCCCLPSTFSL